jgi:hypothetical protein
MLERPHAPVTLRLMLVLLVVGGPARPAAVCLLVYRHRRRISAKLQDLGAGIYFSICSEHAMSTRSTRTREKSFTHGA